MRKTPKSKGFVWIIVAIVALVILFISVLGYIVYSRNTDIQTSPNLNLKALRSKLTPEIRLCIVGKLGKVKAQQLLEEARQTREVPPEDLSLIKSCLPYDLTEKVFPTQTTNAPAISSSGERKLGAQVSPEEVKVVCQALKKSKVTDTTLWVRWGEIDRGNGNYDWTLVDGKIKSLQSCGLEVAVHLQARKNKSINFDMSEMNSYLTFLTNFVTRYKGQIKRYSIENEAVASAVWPETPEDYFTLLDQSYKTIKQVNPAAIVEDAGISSVSLGIMASYDFYQSGNKEGALALAQKVFAGSQSMRSKSPSSIADLENIFKSAEGQRTINWLSLLKQHQNSLDVYQLHFYGDWDVLQQLLSWIKTQGINKPFEVWELAKHYPQNSDEIVEAQDAVKLLTTAVGEGSQFTLFTKFLEWPEKNLPGLANRQGAQPAATAFRITVEKLTGATNSSRLSLGNNVYGYKFSKNGKDIFVVWSLSSHTVQLPFTGNASITDIQGNSSKVNSNRVLVTISPIFIELK